MSFLYFYTCFWSIIITIDNLNAEFVWLFVSMTMKFFCSCFWSVIFLIPMAFEETKFGWLLVFLIINVNFVFSFYISSFPLSSENYQAGSYSGGACYQLLCSWQSFSFRNEKTKVCDPPTSHDSPLWSFLICCVVDLQDWIIARLQ